VLKGFKLGHALTHPSWLSGRWFIGDKSIRVISVWTTAATGVFDRKPVKGFTDFRTFRGVILRRALESAEVSVLPVTSALPLLSLNLFLTSCYDFVEYALCIRVEVKDLLDAFVRLVHNFNIPLLGDDALIEKVLVD